MIHKVARVYLLDWSLSHCHPAARSLFAMSLGYKALPQGETENLIPVSTMGLRMDKLSLHKSWDYSTAGI